MAKKESVDERLNNLIKYWDNVLVDAGIVKQNQDETTPEELSYKFGLSISQAKAWLQKEPNYIPNSSRRFLTKSRRKPKQTKTLKDLFGTFINRFFIYPYDI